MCSENIPPDAKNKRIAWLGTSHQVTMPGIGFKRMASQFQSCLNRLYKRKERDPTYLSHLKDPLAV